MGIDRLVNILNMCFLELTISNSSAQCLNNVGSPPKKSNLIIFSGK